MWALMNGVLDAQNKKNIKTSCKNRLFNYFWINNDVYILIHILGHLLVQFVALLSCHYCNSVLACLCLTLAKKWWWWLLLLLYIHLYSPYGSNQKENNNIIIIIIIIIIKNKNF